MKINYFILFFLFGHLLIISEGFTESFSEKNIHVDKYKRIYLKGGDNFFLRISNSGDDDATSIPLFNLDGKKESIRLFNQGAHLIGHQHKRNGRLNRKNNFILFKTINTYLKYTLVFCKTSKSKFI